MRVKLAKGTNGEKVRFFQSSVPYLNNNAVAVYARGKTSHWRLEEPQPSSPRLLSLSNGHYGIYFTILNHELKREDHPTREQTAPVIVMFVPKSSRQFFPEFFISKANQDFNKCISELKTVLRDLLSSWSLVRPRSLFRAATRKFSSSAHISEDNPKDAKEEPFLISFQKSQLDKIMAVFSSHNSPADLNVIYPLFQGLKRNDITLRSVDEYNIVLKSICMRQLDSESTLSAIESRLTCLLTVYQDLLAACASNPVLKPNTETFNIILSALFKGSLEAINIETSSKINIAEYKNVIAQSTQFCQVGMDLYLSIKEYRELDSKDILPNMVSVLATLPNLVTKPAAERLVLLHETQVSDARFYCGLISLAQPLRELNPLLLDSKLTYQYIASVFESFKAACASNSKLRQLEFEVYSSLIKALVSNNNLAMATKFLDQILLDFKRNATEGQSNLSSQNSSISHLVSTYLDAIMASGELEDLHRAYNLLQTFKLVPYIPELSIKVFNTMINGFINRYSVLELEKASTEQKESFAREQVTVYKKIWELYDYAAIRKDFLSELLALSKPSLGNKVNCRDFLLSLSLDLNDHSNVSRLLKEIFLKDHVVSDWNISKKMCLYLYNGVVAYNNPYYCNLLWNFVEQQGGHYLSSTEANSFLSEHIGFLLNQNGANLDLLLNSMIVSRAFSEFSLETDNIYGLMSICWFFIACEQQIPLRPDQAFKVLQFKSCFVNQFEDASNHYIQLSQEIIQFKRELYTSFKHLYGKTPMDAVTTDISQAATSLNLKSSREAQITTMRKKDVQLDLSPHFNVSPVRAHEKFLEAFKSGFNFNYLTWNMIINRDFAMDALEKGTILNVKEFVQRILDLKLESIAILQLLSSLIDLKIDKINIALFKYLASVKSQLLAKDEILDKFSDYSLFTDNKYFLDLFFSRFHDLASQNKNKMWVGKFLSKLVFSGHTKEVADFLALDFESNLLGLELEDKLNEQFLNVALTAFTNEGMSSEVNRIFAHYFSGADGNKRLLESECFLLCLINYYVVNGSHKTVLEKFDILRNRSPKIKQAIEFARFMAKLNGDQAPVAEVTGEEKDVRTVALALLQKHRVGDMRQIFEESKLSYKTREQLFDCMVKYLTKATHLSNQNLMSVLVNKFESVLKFCKEIRMNELSVDNLVTIIRFLAAVKAQTLLNVIVNKVIHDNSVTPGFNFYFLHFQIPTARVGLQLLQEFKKALTEVGDDVNLSMVEACEQAMV